MLLGLYIFSNKQSSLRKHVRHLRPPPPRNVSIFAPTTILRHVLCFAVSCEVVNRVVSRQKCHRGKVTGERKKKEIKRALRTIESGRVQELAHSRQVVMVSALLICSLLPRLSKAG